MDYVIVNGELYHSDQLYHHGIKGMKWGRRRWQNADGSLTPAGKKRYITNFEATSNAGKAAKEAYKNSMSESRAAGSGLGSYRKAANKASEASKKAYSESIAKDKAYNRQLRADKKQAKAHKKALEKEYGELENQMTYGKNANAKKNAAIQKRMSEIEKELNSSNAKAKGNLTPEQQAARRKKALKVGAAVAGTALAAYGAYKLNEYVKTKNCQIAAERGRASAEKLFFKLQDDAQREIYNNKSMIRNSVNIDVNARARENARAASNDSFRKAARNVINYKQSGGKLSALSDLDRWREERWFRYESRR